MITVVAKTHALDKADAQEYKSFCYKAGLSDGSPKDRLEYAYLIWVNLPDEVRRYTMHHSV